MQLSLADSRCVVVAGSLEELIKHGLRALRDTLPNETDLNTKVSLTSPHCVAMTCQV